MATSIFTEETLKVLKTISAEKVKTIPAAIADQLTGTGLSYRQAIALLDYTKDRLKDTRI
ncbi:MAG: hypothetical protein LUG44_09285 [Clostridiales bacterium]|nr:hypothetical protein [Clostridiales bacterium]